MTPEFHLSLLKRNACRVCFPWSIANLHSNWLAAMDHYFWISTMGFVDSELNMHHFLTSVFSFLPPFLPFCCSLVVLLLLLFFLQMKLIQILLTTCRIELVIFLCILCSMDILKCYCSKLTSKFSREIRWAHLKYNWIKWDFSIIKTSWKFVVTKNCCDRHPFSYS